MKYVLVFLTFFASQVLAFNPNDLIGGEVKEIKPCQDSICLFIEKGGEKYIVVGVTDGESFFPTTIYIVEGKKLRKLWSIDMKET